ncbi:MAG TPA: CapA family protein [Gemmatimonadales bacterium]
MIPARAWLLPALIGAAAACARPTPEPVPAPRPAPPPPAADTVAAVPVDTVPAEPAEPVRRYPDAVTLSFTGDINLGTTTLPDGLPPDSGRALLAAAAPHLAGDLVVGNLEGVFADTGVSEKCIDRAALARLRRAGREPEEPPVRPNCYAFRTPAYLADRLREAGFTHLNLANNHSGDLGAAGRASTLAALRANALVPYGPLGSIAIDTVRRGDSTSTVALVGFTTYPFAYNLLDIERSAAVVDSVRRLADIVVVTFHGGAEGAKAVRTGTGPEFLGSEPRGDLRRWARAVIDAGADAVVGHGPHVLRGIEFHRGRPIAYSLGNFATYRGFNVEGVRGLTGVLRLEFSGRGEYRGARFVPMTQPPRRGPMPDPRGAALALMRQLSADDFGEHAARFQPDGTILPP